MGEQVDAPRPVLFASARVVATTNAMDSATRHGVKITALLERHFAGDWGAVLAHEAAQNEAVLAIHLAGNGGGTLLSDYPLDDDLQGEHLWVVTHLEDGGVTNSCAPTSTDAPVRP